MSKIAESLSSLIIPIDDIKPSKLNIRRHNRNSLDALIKSLQAYGQRKPIIVNAATKTIEAGNGLWLAAKELEWESIAVVMVEDNPEQAGGFAIIDNQSALLSEWNIPHLKELLQKLDDNSFDMALTGFTDKDIAELGITIGSFKYFGINREATPAFNIRPGVMTATRWKKNKTGDSEDYEQFAKWKQSPSEYPALTAEMANDLSELIAAMFGNWRGFIITVPPQGASKGSEYAAGFLGKQVATNLGVDFVTIFSRPSSEKKYHHPQESLKDEETYSLTVEPNRPTVIVDDAITSGETARRCLRACTNNLVFFIAWVKNSGRK